MGYARVVMTSVGDLPVGNSLLHPRSPLGVVGQLPYRYGTLADVGYLFPGLLHVKPRLGEGAVKSAKICLR
jgi:hypothetical protein